MTARIQNTHGFTLLELILSLGIVGFIVGIALGGVRLGMSAREAGVKKADTFQRFRIIGEQLSQKIKSAYPVFVSTAPGRASDTKPGADTKILAFEGEPDSIRLISFAVPLTAGGSPPWAHETQVYLGAHPRTGERGVILMERDIRAGDVFEPDPARSKEARHYLLASGVQDLRFRYYALEEERATPFQNENAHNDAPAKGSWVSRIRYQPPQIQDPAGKDGKRQAADRKQATTLPKGVEIVIGWKQEAESELRHAPPIVVPLHTGMQFTLAQSEEDAET